MTAVCSQKLTLDIDTKKLTDRIQTHMNFLISVMQPAILKKTTIV